MTSRCDAATVVYAFLDFGDGGAQRLSLTTWRLLDRERYRPHLLCVRDRGRLADEAKALGVPVAALGRLRRPYDLGAVAVIAGWLRRRRPAIVQVPLYSRCSPYVRLAARWASVPLVIAHEHCRGRPPSAVRALADRCLLPGTHFLAVSEAMRRELISRGVPGWRIAVIENGVDTDGFAPADRVGARRRLGLDEAATIILVPARLEPRKGHTDFLAALASLAPSVPNMLALCAGGGPAQSALQALGNALGLEGVVRWLGHRADMADLYAAADLVCLPSRVEGLPLVILEAMACGRVVVATDAGGVAEAIEDGVTGRVVAVSQPAALAQTLGDLLAHPAVRSRMETAARERAVACFDARRMVRRLTACYDGWLLEARCGRPAARATIEP